MSYGNNQNMLKTGNKKMDKERMEMQYQNEDEYKTLTDFRSNRQQPLQSTGRESTKIRCYRSATVCLVLLCVLLLTAVIVLCVLINTNIHQCHKTKNELRKTLSEADGWTYYQSSFYFISSEQKSWTDSRRYCRERGADLIIINNREEQDFINFFTGKERHWIGLSDSDVEGIWKWVDGSTLTSVFWKSGEPNGHSGENCVETHSSEWNDYSCNKAIQWICEKKMLLQ
nr:CD209 antigen-like protein E [Misgurnus anguillicaudatus]